MVDLFTTNVEDTLTEYILKKKQNSFKKLISFMDNPPSPEGVSKCCSKFMQLMKSWDYTGFPETDLLMKGR